MCCNSFFKDGTCSVQFNLHNYLCVCVCVCLNACLFLKKKNFPAFDWFFCFNI